MDRTSVVTASLGWVGWGVAGGLMNRTTRTSGVTFSVAGTQTAPTRVLDLPCCTHRLIATGVARDARA